jgi:hypothetical protein
MATARRRLRPPETTVSAQQVLAFRLQRLGLQQPAANVRAAAGDVGLPDYPPQAALHALAPRLATASEETLESAFERRQLVRLRAMRGAPVVVRTEEYAIFAAGVLPPDEAAMRAFIGPAMKSVQQAKLSAMVAVELATQHAVSALSRGALDRDQLHAELRRALPKALLPYCRGCQTHHAHPSLVYAVALQGRLVVLPREQGPYLVARLDRWLKPAERGRVRRVAKPAVELLRRFLRAYGPARPGDFAAWAGVSTAQARSAWADLEPELTAVTLEGAEARAGARYVLSEDVKQVASSRAFDPAVVRLLSPGDPLLQMRDRELLVPERKLQQSVWKTLAPSGLVLAGPKVVAIARIRKQRDTLLVNLQALGKVPAGVRATIDDEAARLATVRSCGEARVVWG